MKKYDCLCFGACVIDQRENETGFDLGGDAANQTILLKRMGLNPVLWAGIGQDQNGQKIYGRLNSLGISTEALISKPEWETTISLIHLDEKKERSFTVSGGAHRKLTADDFPWPLLDQCRALSLGSLFTLHELEENGLEEILAAAKQKKMMIFSDTTSDRHQKGLKKAAVFFPYFDYFMPSYDEAASLTLKKEPDEIAAVLLEHGCRCVVLKLSDQGAILYRPDKKIIAPAFKANCIDTTGAGDHFAAALIASLLHGLSENEALENACWLGARAVEVIGANAANPSGLPHPLKTAL